MNIEEGKALKRLIHMEERIIRLLKSLEDQGAIFEKEKMIYIHQFLNQEFHMGLPTSTRHWKIEYHYFAQFYQQ